MNKAKSPIVSFVLPIDDIEIKVCNFWPLHQTLLSCKPQSASQCMLRDIHVFSLVQSAFVFLDTIKYLFGGGTKDTNLSNCHFSSNNCLCGNFLTSIL